MDKKLHTLFEEIKHSSHSAHCPINTWQAGPQQRPGDISFVNRQAVTASKRLMLSEMSSGAPIQVETTALSHGSTASSVATPARLVTFTLGPTMYN